MNRGEIPPTPLSIGEKLERITTILEIVLAGIYLEALESEQFTGLSEIPDSGHSQIKTQGQDPRPQGLEVCQGLPDYLPDSPSLAPSITCQALPSNAPSIRRLLTRARVKEA
jgi:hypothetical protein